MCFVTITNAVSQDNTDQSFYIQRGKGWFWHEPEPEPQPPAEESKQKPSSNAEQQFAGQNVQTAPVQQPLNSEWLKANIEKLTMKAVDNPTPENLAAYAYANRLLMDMGSRFSTKMMEFMTLEQELQESNRRPYSAFALSEFADERNKAKKVILDALREKTHIWMFYSTSCGFCMKQVPVLKEFHRLTGIPLLGISMDGGVLPGMEDFEIVYDEGLRVSQMFGVTATPTMHLVVNEQKTPIPLTVGLNSLDEIEKRLLLIARQANVITEEQYELAKEVRDIGVYKNEAGEIMADKHKLENDPAYLVELLKMRLNDKERMTTINSTPVNAAGFKK
jgi:conjugal transfer pilus assembly protein TraF